MRDQLQLQAAANLDNLSMISKFIENSMQKFDMGEYEQFQIQIAVDEAVTNIIEHGELEENVVVKLEYDAEPYARDGDFICLKTYPLKVKMDDLIVLPTACPISTYWYVKASKQSIIPFKIYRVSEVFHKRGCRYIKTEEGREVPVEYMIGVVKNIITQNLLQSCK